MQQKQKQKTNREIAAYLHKKGWRLWNHPKKTMWTKGLLIEDTQTAYKIQKDIDDKEQ